MSIDTDDFVTIAARAADMGVTNVNFVNWRSQIDGYKKLINS